MAGRLRRTGRRCAKLARTFEGRRPRRRAMVQMPSLCRARSARGRPGLAQIPAIHIHDFPHGPRHQSTLSFSSCPRALARPLRQTLPVRLPTPHQAGRPRIVRPRFQDPHIRIPPSPAHQPATRVCHAIEHPLTPLSTHSSISPIRQVLQRFLEAASVVRSTGPCCAAGLCGS